ncbi:hypothetical protein ACFYWN_29520 [Streptomyces sp. NPDC002917]
MHQLDKATVDASLVLNPDQFALPAMQAEQPVHRRKKHRTDPHRLQGR